MRPDGQPADLFAPMNRPRVFESIVAEIERGIIVGRLQPGDRLPNERDLAEMMQVSRNSVREALRVLEMFGAVETHNGRGRRSGTVVARGAQDGVRNTLRLHTLLGAVPLGDIVEVRVMLETQSVRAAALVARQEDCDRLLQMSAEIATAQSPEEANRLDTAFHAELARVSGNALAPAIIEGLREAMVRDMLQGFERLSDWHNEFARGAAEHEKIIRFVAAGDADAAAEAMHAHCTWLFDALKALDLAKERAARRAPG